MLLPFPVRRRTRHLRGLALAICLAGLGAGCALIAPPPAGASADMGEVDTLITGGLVHDGSGAAPAEGDVAIRGDRIVYIGPPRPVIAARVIDATGMIVAPGFIDPHTHADIFLRAPERADRLNLAWLAQGASTVVIGVDGGGTPDVAEDAARLGAAGIGTNVVPFVGFGAIRTRVLGDSARAPAPGELAAMQALAVKAMCEGATGFSTGLFYAPQSFADTDEVIAIAREAGQRGGLYDTHQRDESSYSIGLLASTQEAIRIGEEAGMPVHIAHIKALGVDVHGLAPQVIALVEAARTRGTRVTADQYPWLASGSSLDAALLPGWAVDGGSAALLERLDRPETAARIRGEMAENMRRRGGAETFLLTARDREWSGRTLAQMAQGWGVDPVAAALRIIRQSAGGAGRGTTIASFNMAEVDVEAFMREPWVLTASDGSLGHPRMFATYPEKYRRYVVERGTIDLARFIRQSTGAVADTHGIAERGYLRPGYFADVLVFDPQNFAPRATYLEPTQPAIGVRALFVNGVLALADGRATGEAAGRVLLRPAPQGCP